MSNLELPPTIELLLTEEMHLVSSADALRKHLAKGFLKDLRQQAEFTVESWSYADVKRKEPTGEFVVVPSGLMNPLTPAQKCDMRACRLESARSFARTVGLYADYAIIPDIFSALVLHEHTQEIAEMLFTELSALRELLPLVYGGVMRFGRPKLSLCDDCFQKRNDKVLCLAKSVVDWGAKNFRLSLIDGSDRHFLKIENSLFRSPHGSNISIVALAKHEADRLASMYRRQKGGVLSQRAREALLPQITELLVPTVQDLFFHTTLADNAHATLITGSRIDALLMKQTDLPAASADIENWEHIRSLQLPWIKNLNAQEILQLRDDAHASLARLRPLLCKQLSVENNNSAIVNVVRELEQEAAEISAKLEASSKALGSTFELGLGSLGIGLVMYGLVNDAVMAAGAAVFSGAAKIYSDSRAEKIETAIVQSRPGFALLRARDLLTHRER